MRDQYFYANILFKMKTKSRYRKFICFLLSSSNCDKYCALFFV